MESNLGNGLSFALLFGVSLAIGFQAHAQSGDPASNESPVVQAVPSAPAATAPGPVAAPSAPVTSEPMSNLPTAASADPQSAQVAAPPAGFYYYCARLRAYFPQAETCPEGWVAIPVQNPVEVPRPYIYRYRELPLTAQQSQEIVKQRPTVASVELFGRALNYSFDLDRAVTDHLTLGVGISTWQVYDWWQDYHATVMVVPIYANYYLTDLNRRGFFSAGADLISVSAPGHSDDTFENSGAAAVLGGGYEYRDRSGFVFRLGAYGIIGRSFTFSPSAVCGYAF